MSLIFLSLDAGQYNSVHATLEGWRSTIRAEIAAEKIYYDSDDEDDCEIFRALVNKAPFPPHHGGVCILVVCMRTVSPTQHIMQGTWRASSRLKRWNEDST